MMLINFLSRLSLLLLATTVVNAQTESAQLKAAVVSDKGKILISFKNVADKTVVVGDFSLGESIRTGYWVFLYDVKTGRNQAASAMIYHTPDASRYELQTIQLMPGKTISKEFKKIDLLEYFSYVPDCYFLTTVYRKKLSGEIVFSRPSKPLFFCSTTAKAKKLMGSGSISGR